MREHTPGPWLIGYDGPSRPIILTGDRDIMLSIGRLENGTSHTYENEDADANLIAAAPDMERALEAIRDGASVLTADAIRAIANRALSPIHGLI